MADFINLNSEQPKQKKNFTIPKPGYQSKPTVIIGQAAFHTAKSFINTEVEVSDEAIGTSKIFNQPIYCDITFSGGSYADQDGTTINYDSLNVEDVLVTVMNTKNIVKTTLQGRNGTVKEYISDGDFQIKIEGRVYGKGINNYPQDQVQKLIGLAAVPEALKVTSAFLKLFNIENIVIESYNIDQMEGTRNVQPFIFNCVSDYPLILLKNA